jgi:hypothetical protein
MVLVEQLGAAAQLGRLGESYLQVLQDGLLLGVGLANGSIHGPELGKSRHPCLAKSPLNPSAQLLTQRGELALITSAPPEKLDAQKWLEFNQTVFGGIENGLHQRLDVSHNDDRCRIRHPNAMFVAGLFRRISNGLFMEWRPHQPHPEYLTATDFQAAKERIGRVGRPSRRQTQGW